MLPSRLVSRLLFRPNVVSRILSDDSKVKKDDLGEPNTPIGMIERKPKKEGGLETSPCSTPYPPFPDGVNPETGEIGGPTGPEPTRYGDWERKGRVTDF